MKFIKNKTCTRKAMETQTIAAAVSGMKSRAHFLLPFSGNFHLKKLVDAEIGIDFLNWKFKSYKEYMFADE